MKLCTTGGAPGNEIFAADNNALPNECQNGFLALPNKDLKSRFFLKYLLRLFKFFVRELIIKIEKKNRNSNSLELHQTRSFLFTLTEIEQAKMGKISN